VAGSETVAEVRRVGVSGHQSLAPATRDLVAQAIRAELKRLGPFVGVTSLALGADQIFAKEVLRAGGALHVIVPCANYRTSFQDDEGRRSFDELLSLARSSTQLPFEQPSEEAYMAAGRAVVDDSELLLAVWDGEPAAGLGGTADVVAYANERQRAVRIVWPAGASRR